MNNNGEVWLFAFSENSPPSIEISKENPRLQHIQWEKQKQVVSTCE